MGGNLNMKNKLKRITIFIALLAERSLALEKDRRDLFI